MDKGEPYLMPMEGIGINTPLLFNLKLVNGTLSQVINVADSLFGLVMHSKESKNVAGCSDRRLIVRALCIFFDQKGSVRAAQFNFF